MRSLSDDLTVDAGITDLNMATLLEENDLADLQNKRASSLVNLKNVDFQRLLKMGKRSRRPDYPGSQVFRTF